MFSTVASLLLWWPTASMTRTCCLSLAAVVAMDIGYFCNGLTAFFPWCIPCLRAGRKGLLPSAALALGCALSLGLFYYTVPAAWANTRYYLGEQLFPSVLGDRQLVYVGWQHAHVLLLVLRAYWLVACLAIGAIALVAYIEKSRVCVYPNREGRLFLLLGLAASLPVGISHRQAFSYLMQSAPYMTLSAMCFSYQSIEKLLRISTRRRTCYTLWLVSGLLCLVLSLYKLATFDPTVHRHQLLVQDIHQLIDAIPAHETLSASERVFYGWYAGAYLARYSQHSLTPALSQRYYLALVGEELPQGYSALPLMGKQLQLARIAL